MHDEEHGHEGQRNEHRRIGEQARHAELIHQQAGEHRGDGLRSHACGVINSGVAPHVAAAAHLDHHGEGIDINRRPADAGQREHGVHQHRGAALIEEAGHAEGRRQHRDTREDGLLAADLGGDHANRQVGKDGRALCDHQGHVVVLVQNVACVDRILGGDGVIAHEPQDNGGKQKQKRAPLGLAQPVLFARCLRCVLLNAVDLALFLHPLHELRLAHLPHEDGQRQQHDARDHGEIARVGHHGILGRGSGKDHAEDQNQNTAGGAHEIDDGVCLAAQGLDGHVRHERDRRAAEGRHGDECRQKQRDK